ncbi:MAG TPA: tetratricopeptide repeat protein [Usitatibacter sp.]|jgi:Flp pilus assembly protein TadD|nr:tetratricopeptide repeat protein [Usitatibacter sp.]
MRRWLAAWLAGAVLAALAPAARADPEDTDPDLAARDADYAAGRKALQARDWTTAVARLSRAEVRNPDHADVQNDLGFAYRNLGKYDAAFKHYERALAIDPRHRGAHEYIGETYLLVGDVKGAQRHLEALRAICLLGCEELKDLDEAIAKYRAPK